MFNGLRLRLTILYVSVALLLVALVGSAAYFLVQREFDRATDRALDQRMAREFLRQGLAPPDDLLPANDPLLVVTPLPSSGARPSPRFTGAYDAELAAIYVLHLNSAGSALPSADQSISTPPPDRAAAQSALQYGEDRRTTTVGGTTVRLLTYRVTGGGDVAVFQIGRSLNDQDRTLGRLLLGLLVFGGVIAVLLGLGGWALAGRSIRPVMTAWERQQSFVANASHELRTPLTLLRASAEVVQRRLPAEDARGRGLMDDILGECDHLAQLIADLLLLSRLDAGVLPLRREVIAVSPLLADLGREVERLAAERDVRLVLAPMPAAKSLTVWADVERLRQVLLIAIDNALKHTPAGGEVRLGACHDGRRTQLVVTDTGTGIPLEALDRVFDRFFQVDTAHTSREGGQGGSGLGLSIAKSLIDAHAGTIAIASDPGQGTTVTISLPAEAS